MSESQCSNLFTGTCLWCVNMSFERRWTVWAVHLLISTNSQMILCSVFFFLSVLCKATEIALRVSYSLSKAFLHSSSWSH